MTTYTQYYTIGKTETKGYTIDNASMETNINTFIIIKPGNNKYLDPDVIQW